MKLGLGISECQKTKIAQRRAGPLTRARGLIWASTADFIHTRKLQSLHPSPIGRGKSTRPLLPPDKNPHHEQTIRFPKTNQKNTRAARDVTNRIELEPEESVGGGGHGGSQRRGARLQSLHLQGPAPRGLSPSPHLPLVSNPRNSLCRGDSSISSGFAL